MCVCFFPSNLLNFSNSISQMALFAPDEEWRCKEDLKVILIAPENCKISKGPAQLFFERFGRVHNVYLNQHDRIACGTYMTEEEAEEALKERAVVLGGVYCDVTTYKSGNRKIYIAPLTLSDRALRRYFETNYGTVLRVEALPGQSACFILFLKVDAAVAARNKHHCISGCNVFARPGCTPGTSHIPDRASMYRVTHRLISVMEQKHSASGLPSSRQSLLSSPRPRSFPTPRSSVLFPSPSSSSCSSAESDYTPDEYLKMIAEMRYLSIDAHVEEKKTKKKNLEKDRSILDWKNYRESTKHEELKPIVVECQVDTEYENRAMQSGSSISVDSTPQSMDESAVYEDVPPPKTPPKSTFTSDEKWDKWEARGKEFNLPPLYPSAHYAIDNDGYPVHHNGKYIHSILKDGRFRAKDNNHVSFKKEPEVRMFERADFEYLLFGPRNGILSESKEDEEDDGWGNESIAMPTYTCTQRGFPTNLTWPYQFPTMPQHFPLLENCTFEKETKLDFETAVVKYMHHLEERWRNTKQKEFLSKFAPFLRRECSICTLQLDSSKKQFEHLFSRTHLNNLTRRKVKYTASDFTFWNNLLLENYSNGKRRRHT